MKSQETEQIDSIAVCVVTNNNEDETKFFIENLIQKTSGNFTLYIYDYQSTSKDFLHHFKILRIDKYRFDELKKANRLKLNFVDYPTMLIKMINNCIKDPTK